jgi:hypothetical protein
VKGELSDGMSDIYSGRWRPHNHDGAVCVHSEGRVRFFCGAERNNWLKSVRSCMEYVLSWDTRKFIAMSKKGGV